MKTHYKAQRQAETHDYGVNALPLDRPVAAYYRQSTGAQVGNISTLIQTVDLKAYLRQKGWAEDNIILIDTDQGVSGQKKIDEREGMSQLFEMIVSDQIGAVACQDEDRLFRDQTQIQVNIFIEACKAHRVIVMTPYMLYDFAHSTMGSFYIRQFRAKCEMAADYINSIVNGRLYAARERMQGEGKWCGGSIPVGYMVDLRRTLPDGSANPSWRKFVLFEPYAEVVRAYYKVFLEAGCVTRTAIRKIQNTGPWFPNSAAPDGFKINYRLAHFHRTRCPSRRGLVQMLTNAAYLGHWVVRGVIVKPNNHEQLIDEPTFHRVFNFISEVGLDGTPNKHHLQVRAAAKPRGEAVRSAPQPLCWGLVTSPVSETHYVGVHWQPKVQGYEFVCTDNVSREERFVWSKSSAQIDEAVVSMFRQKLASTFEDEQWRTIVESKSVRFANERKLVQAQIDAVSATLENLISSLSQLSTPALIKAVESNYAAAKAEKERLEGELSKFRQESDYLELLHQLRANYRRASDEWELYSRDEQRAILLMFVQAVEVIRHDERTTELIVRWRDNTFDSVLLRKRGGKAEGWLTEELEQLQKFVRYQTPQVEVAAAFPNRSWKAIVHAVRRTMGIYYGIGRKKIKDHETYSEYMSRINAPMVVASDTHSQFRRR